MLSITSFTYAVPHTNIVVIIACMGIFDWFHRRYIKQIVANTAQIVASTAQTHPKASLIALLSEDRRIQE